MRLCAEHALVNDPGLTEALGQLIWASFAKAYIENHLEPLEPGTSDQLARFSQAGNEAKYVETSATEAG